MQSYINKDAYSAEFHYKVATETNNKQSIPAWVCSVALVVGYTDSICYPLTIVMETVFMVSN